MRREGFELTVGKPEVVTQEIDGTLHEPAERLTIDVPEEHVGAVTQLLASRKGPMETCQPRHRLGPTRVRRAGSGLIGFRTEFLTETRGTGMLHHVFDGCDAVGGRAPEPRSGSRRRRPHRPTTSYAIHRSRSGRRSMSARAARSTRA